ncbi:ATP-binding protein [Flavobacterium sp. TR2]|uniref:ATP-binding protein n=1 Tax=Flavobacterium sp. TR2 TaxID=2977321 RepID=UPI0021B140CD|nr:ATP-binding protein [Flavobacterium sp. TR2]UWY29987.1 ATP-binding protein [Flavobacterium sp. TR2]
MKIKLQNIGIIEEADINIEGITLIAGQNDSGKSTVGKVLYALIRGVNGDEISHNANKIRFVYDKTRDIRNLLSRTTTTNENDQNIQNKFISEFLEKLEIRPSLLHSKKDVEIINSINNALDAVLNLYDNYSNQQIKEKLSEFINDFNHRTSISFDSTEALHYRLESFLKNEFGNQISNSFNKSDSFIKIGGIEEKSIYFKDKIEFLGLENSSSFYYDEVIFIESPLRLTQTYFVRFNEIIDKNDHLNKLIFLRENELSIFSDDSSKNNNLLSMISKVINGDFNIDSLDEIVFTKNATEFEFGNIATGIKSFGILQLLLQKGKLNSNTLLIIDEPEVHLHPTWQVKFAEILVLLSKELAIPILLTSHSPYFIEALEAYSKKYQYEKSTNFYFAEKKENGLCSKIIDVTKNISPILSSISEAFYTIQDLNDEN